MDRLMLKYLNIIMYIYILVAYISYPFLLKLWLTFTFIQNLGDRLLGCMGIIHKLRIPFNVLFSDTGGVYMAWPWENVAHYFLLNRKKMTSSLFHSHKIGSISSFDYDAEHWNEMYVLVDKLKIIRYSIHH